MTRRRYRRALIVVASVVAFVALCIAAGLPVYVFPPQRAPQKSDVIFVLGLAQPWRVAWAEQLIAEGKSDALLISEPPGYDVPVCSQPEPFTVICEPPVPSTTRGEARLLRREMASHGWKTATVITFTPQVVRARVRMDRCVPHGVTVVGRPTGLRFSDWVYQYFYQTAGFVKVVLQRGC